MSKNGVVNNNYAAEQHGGAAQRIIVAARRGSHAVVSFQQKNLGIWQTQKESVGWIGCHGLGKREEGDGRTPAGSLSFLYAFGICPNPGTSFPYLRIDSSHYLVDDVSSRYYNQIVSRRDVLADWRSAEHMAEMKDAYCYGLVTDYNKGRVPGIGSGIFLHCEESRPTSGCISVPKDMVIWLLQNMVTDCYMIIDFPEGKCYT